MDQGRMRTTVALLLSAEERLRIQWSLQQIEAALVRLERAPKWYRVQYNAEKNLRSLSRKLEKFEAALAHNQRKNLTDIKALQFFSTSLISDSLRLLEIDPPESASARQLLTSIVAERAKFVSALRVLQAHFDANDDYSPLSCVTLAY
jgi:hypothetical protein